MIIIKINLFRKNLKICKINTNNNSNIINSKIKNNLTNKKCKNKIKKVNIMYLPKAGSINLKHITLLMILLLKTIKNLKK